MGEELEQDIQGHKVVARVVRIVGEIHRLVRSGQVWFSDKATLELQDLDMGLDEDDGRRLLLDLSAEDFHRRIRSKRFNG